MSFLRTTDNAYALRFLRLLTMPWRDTAAFKEGLIDNRGERTDKPILSDREKNAYNLFHRLVFNIRRLIELAPGGRQRISNYISALLLIRECTELSEKEIMSVLVEAFGPDIAHIPLNESKESKKLKLVSTDCAFDTRGEFRTSKQFLIQEEHTFLGVPVYKGTDLQSAEIIITSAINE